MKIAVTTDESVKSSIINALKENGGYCPCRLQRTPDTHCMCKEFREQDTPGPCHCGLYIKLPD